MLSKITLIILVFIFCVLFIPTSFLTADDPPGPPTGLTATPSVNLIALDWNDNTEPDLAGYNIYRTTFSGNYYTKINPSLITQSTYQDAAIVEGSEYFYAVTAEDTSTNESNYSNEARVFANLATAGQLIKTKTWSSQSDWQTGTPSQVDLASSPGNVQLERGGEFFADEHTVALWHCNEGTGTTLVDSSGNGNDGTINGATWADGMFGKALRFDGADDYVTYGNTGMDIIGDITVEALIKTPSSWPTSESYPQIISRGSDNVTGWNLYLSRPDNTAWRKFSFILKSGSAPWDANWAFDTETALLDTWYYLAGVREGTNVKLYVNGILKATDAGTAGGINYGAGPINNLIGMKTASPPQDHWNGLIDEIRISNIARTDFNSGREFLSPGTLTLDFDTSQRSNFVRLEWDSEEIPGETNVKVRIKTADTEEGLDTAPWSNYYDSSAAELINMIDRRWMRTEAYLEGLDFSNTPLLNNLTIYYARFHPYLDVNRDGLVDAKDDALIESGFGLVKGDPAFNPYLDVNDDGVINASDTTVVINNYGALVPHAPLAVSVAPGAGNSRNEINASNYSGVTVEVVLPETSVDSDMVTVVLFDGVNNVTATAAALNGAGTLAISGIDTGILLDTRITLKAYVENVAGKSASFVGEDVFKNVALATITSPSENQVIAGGGSFVISGSALAPIFDSYVVEYGVGVNPVSWTTIATSASPVDHGILATWDVPQATSASYTLRLRVIGDGVTAATVVVGINILSIYNLSDTPDPFSPNGDGIKDNTTVSADFTYPADWQLTIQSSAQQVVKTFSGNSAQAISVTWDGKDINGQILADGNYTYQVQIIEPSSGVTVLSATGTVRIDNTSPTAEITLPSANDFVFNVLEIAGTANDLNFDYYTVEYEAGPNPSAWIIIQPQTATPVVNGTLANWNTFDLANGNYTIKLTAADTAGNISIVEVPVVADNIKITTVSTEPTSFNPSLGETVAINYSIDHDANVTGIIQDLYYNIIKVIGPNPRLAGPNTEVWDGFNETGAIPADGAYTFTLNVTDGVRFSEHTPDYIPNGVAVSGFSLNSGFDPHRNELCTIAYTVADDAFVLIQAGGTGGNDPYWPILNWKPRESGLHIDYWNGRDPNNNIVDLNSAVVAIWAQKLPDEPIIVVNGLTVDASTDPYSIIPSYGEFTMITYAISKPANVTVSVYNPEGTLVTVLEDNLAKNAGAYTIAWDGTNAGGGLACEQGNYTIKVTAIGGDGKTATTFANVTVH